MNTLRNSLKRSYSQIPNELITDMSLSHGELRVLLYLFTKPDDWNVYNKDICNNLGISEQTLTKYWKNLIKSKWLRRETSRDKDGKLTGGYDYRIGNFTGSIESTEPVKSIDHSNNKPINKQVTNKRLFTFKLNRSVQYEHLSDTYKNNLLAYAVTQSGNKAKQLLDAMIDHHSSKGNTFKDWSAAFRTWKRNDEKFNGSKDVVDDGKPRIIP